MAFLNTFRGRLLLILLIMLVATIGVQYYLNLRTQQESLNLRRLQSQALVAGTAIGFASITSSRDEDRVEDLLNRPGQTFIDPETRAQIIDIIVIDNQWRVRDAVNDDYEPTFAPQDDAPKESPSNASTDSNSAERPADTSTAISNKSAKANSDDAEKPNPTNNASGDARKIIYKNLSDLKDLPPLMEGSRLGDDLKYFPNVRTEQNRYRDDEAHAIPLETTNEGRWYVVVLLKNDRSETARRAAQPLIYMLGVLLVSTFITFVLVWRFTTPIANLSNAARQVAEGKLGVRVPDDKRGDEMGQLAERFNEMTAQLEKNRELETQLQQAEKSAVVGRLGSAIAHEIRNPLNYINLTLDHLRSKFSPEDEGKREQFEKLTSQLKSEVARINQQISDFLNYSRPAKADLQPIDARKVIEDSLRIAEAQAAENDVKISVVEHENVPQIMGDPEFLRSVFNNLFINALQAMGSDGGSLNIKITPDDLGDFVKFEIADTGKGIPKENLGKIFEPYYSTKETGTGLGLAIVQKIVDIHEGLITVESNDGKGTKFTVRLPEANHK